MDNRPIESKVLALEAVIKAILRTHPEPAKVFNEFTRIYPDIAKQLNKSGVPENAEIAKGLMAECDLLVPYFPRK